MLKGERSSMLSCPYSLCRHRKRSCREWQAYKNSFYCYMCMLYGWDQTQLQKGRANVVDCIWYFSIIRTEREGLQQCSHTQLFIHIPRLFQNIHALQSHTFQDEKLLLHTVCNSTASKNLDLCYFNSDYSSLIKKVFVVIRKGGLVAP